MIPLITLWMGSYSPFSEEAVSGGMTCVTVSAPRGAVNSTPASGLSTWLDSGTMSSLIARRGLHMSSQNKGPRSRNFCIQDKSKAKSKDVPASREYVARPPGLDHLDDGSRLGRNAGFPSIHSPLPLRRPIVRALFRTGLEGVGPHAPSSLGSPRICVGRSILRVFPCLPALVEKWLATI